MSEEVMPVEAGTAAAQAEFLDAAPEPDEPAKSLQMQAERNDAGQFLRGQSGNPVGRVPGTRNRATMIMEQLFDGASSDVSNKALADALMATARRCG